MVYTIHYQMYRYDRTRMLDVIAQSKQKAYADAVYNLIPSREQGIPYAAWVDSVTYQNGNHRTFNTFAGKPY